VVTTVPAVPAVAAAAAAVAVAGGAAAAAGAAAVAEAAGIAARVAFDDAAGVDDHCVGGQGEGGVVGVVGVAVVEGEQDEPPGIVDGEAVEGVGAGVERGVGVEGQAATLPQGEVGGAAQAAQDVQGHVGDGESCGRLDGADAAEDGGAVAGQVGAGEGDDRGEPLDLQVAGTGELQGGEGIVAHRDGGAAPILAVVVNHQAV